MQSDQDKTLIRAMTTQDEQLSHADLMVSFHLLRDDDPSLALSVRNLAVDYVNFQKDSSIHQNLAAAVVRELEKREIPGSLEMLMMVNRLIHRWQLISQPELFTD